MSTRQSQHPLFARVYLLISREVERNGAGEYRRRLTNGLRGRVVEIGAGHGVNFPYYPDTVSEVLAVEPDDVLRRHAESAARSVPAQVSVVNGHADALPADDGSLDAAVASLMLCSVPNLHHALSELYRALRPGGELRFFEHVRSTQRWVATVQDAIAPLFRHCAGGCRPNRDTLAAIKDTGFTVVEVDHFGFAHGRGTPSMPHILGIARKPITAS
jgi:ubiquinone/menaquinone biosynthesis C-methylase UbiE